MRATTSNLTGRWPGRLALAALLSLLLLPACRTNPTTGPAGDDSRGDIALIGTLDQATGDVISGWAADRNRPDTPIQVDIFDGDKKLETVLADQFRDDLLRDEQAKALVGNGKHGFTYPTPPSLKDGKPHTIRVKGT